jgi:hypothetical protein
MMIKEKEEMQSYKKSISKKQRKSSNNFSNSAILGVPGGVVSLVCVVPAYQ